MKRITRIAVILTCVLLAAGVIAVASTLAREKIEEIPDPLGTHEIPAVEYAHLAAREDIAGQTAELGAEAWSDAYPLYQEYQAWLASLIDPSASAITLNSCRIENGEVVVRGKANGVIRSDDGRYCLYAQNMTQAGAEGTELASIALEEVPEDGTLEFHVPLNKNTASSNLFKRFYFGVVYREQKTAVSAKRYIENPGACADHTAARNDHGKKGLLPAAALIRSDGLKNLGIQQALYNMTLGSLCAGSGINYTYNGKTYTFSSTLISQYDIVVQRMNSQGVQVSMVILNNPAGDSSMLHPKARGGSAHYYAFNTAEQDGIDRLAAAASFLTERYSGTGHGTIDNWIIGNEVNARADWHYMSDPGLGEFAQAYADAFRIFYNAIKSRNANARIYISIDQQWAKSANTAGYYAGKDFLSAFNNALRREGNLDWDVAVHPYDVPLYDPYAWKSSAYAPHSQDARYLTMRNIDVLTDFLGQADYLSPSGQVRSVLCSEVGYTSSQGEGIQAAAVVYGYQQAMHNSHIDGFILSRELDDAGEIAQGLANGLLNGAAQPKQAYSYYQAMGTAAEQQYIDAAAAIMGVTDFGSLLTNR